MHGKRKTWFSWFGWGTGLAGAGVTALSVFAGGGPPGYVVVYNPADPRSVTIANHYQQVRNIPERNRVSHVFSTRFTRTTAWDFICALLQALMESGEPAS